VGSEYVVVPSVPGELVLAVLDAPEITAGTPGVAGVTTPLDVGAVVAVTESRSQYVPE